MGFLASTAGKVVSAALALAVVAAGIAWWQMEPETRSMLLSGTGKIVSWLLIVLLVPWATFFVIARVEKVGSNVAGGILVAAYSLLEVLLLAWLFHWTVPGATAWTFFVVAALFAAVYNFFTCDWIADRLA
jgi:FtsH-binding integral membrane protein